MISRILIGVTLSLAIGLGTTTWLWRNAAENAQEATQEARRLEADLTLALDSERRTGELVDAVEAIVGEWDAQRQIQQEVLAATRRDLDQIRKAAREETADENLICAVQPVPGVVDRLLRGLPGADD